MRCRDGGRGCGRTAVRPYVLAVFGVGSLDRA